MSEVAITASDVEPIATEIQGVTLQILHIEPSGGMTGIAHFAPGAVIPEHWHTHADETVYVLSGSFVANGVTYGVGTFYSVTEPTRHGPHSTVDGCSLLYRYSAQPDVNWVS